MPIVEAVGIAVTPGRYGKEVARAIEQAMSQAILDANAEGISSSEENSVELRRRMMEARQRVIDALG